MSMNEAQRLLTDMASDETLARTVAARIGADDIAAEARNAGYDVTAEDFHALKAQAAAGETDAGETGSRELSDDELDHVVGGFSFGLLTAAEDFGKAIYQTGASIGDGVTGHGFNDKNHLGNALSDVANGVLRL